MHSSEHTNGKDNEGKKVVIIGSCTSGGGQPAGLISSMLTISIQHMTLRKTMREPELVRQIICTSNLQMLMAGIRKDVTMIQRGSTYIMSIENGVLGLHKR